MRDHDKLVGEALAAINKLGECPKCGHSTSTDPHAYAAITALGDALKEAQGKIRLSDNAAADLLEINDDLKRRLEEYSDGYAIAENEISKLKSRLEEVSGKR